MSIRTTAALVPYFLKDNHYYFFVQMRDAGAPTYPKRIGLFGGGIEEKETPQEAVCRETAEELSIQLVNERYFKTWMFPSEECHVFVLETNEQFPETVTVCEGEWGRFLSESEIAENPTVLEWSRDILLDLAEYLRAEERGTSQDTAS